MLGKAKDQALTAKEEVIAMKALVSKVAADVVEAFRVREYCLEVLEVSRDAF